MGQLIQPPKPVSAQHMNDETSSQLNSRSSNLEAGLIKNLGGTSTTTLDSCTCDIQTAETTRGKGCDSSRPVGVKSAGN